MSIAYAKTMHVSLVLAESIDEVRLDLMMKINAADVDEKIEER